MYRLKGRIQPYAWGGNHFIPDLFNIDADKSKPAAEYWLGTHPGGITEIEVNKEKWESLAFVIDEDKQKWLGPKISKTFGRLPFLLKVLDVKDMLSIQVHPSKEAAIKGFHFENERGIPLNAPHRNYKDDNHKPEIMIALSEFWLLHGFANNIEECLEKYSFLSPYRKNFQDGGIKNLYKTLMELEPAAVNEIFSRLAARLLPLYKNGTLEKSSPDFWAARAIEHGSHNGVYDRGIFSIYLFNLICLHPGEGIFQGAGMPHAYLEGQNIELMSNSDNVLRAGLTEKHIDIQELLKNTLFNETNPNIIKPKQGQDEQHYDCPVPDFALDSYALKQGAQKDFHASGPEILLMISGTATIMGDRAFDVSSAEAFYCLPDENYQIRAQSDIYFVVARVG